MNRQEFQNNIYVAIDHIDNAPTEKNGRIIHGHPCFYLKNDKDEFDMELGRVISNKETFSKYDFNYVLNHMIKYELNEYDSHTRAYFYDVKRLPILFKVIDNKVYIINSLYKDYIGMEVKSINGVSIEKVIEELDFMTCYASFDYFKGIIANSLSDVSTLKSLPSIGDVDKITFEGDYSKLTIDTNKIDDWPPSTTRSSNYEIEVYDDTLKINYLACRDENQMIEAVETMKNTEGIEHYIVSIRGNYGGNSNINNHLVEFLKDKDTYVLCDERVFSSARMCLADLKKNGATVIGKRPGTPVSAFGNLGNKKYFLDMKMLVVGSVNYWYYDEDLNLTGLTKENFRDVLKNHPEILETRFLDVDYEVDFTLEDYLTNNDTMLQFTLDLIKEKNEVKKR